MSEDARGAKLRNRVLFVANPSSSSEDSEEDRRRDMNAQYNHGNFRPNRVPQRSPVYSHHPTPLTTNLPSAQLSQTPSYPGASSPSSTGSPAAEEPNPPSSGSGISSSRGDLTPDTSTSREPLMSNGNSDRILNDSRECNTSRTGRILQTLKSPFHSKTHPRLHPDVMKRPRTSPTVSTPDSSSSLAPPSIVPSNVLIVVTTDSDWYVAVDVGGAKSASFVRECIFNKLNIQDDEQLRFAIYQTEMGAFAIGEALSDDKLFSLCRDHGDSKGSLKFFVSHSSASVHEPPFRPHSPTATLPPPTLPPNLPPPAPSYHESSALRIKRRSRNESVSSVRDPKEETAAGYEADLETTKTPSHPTHIPSSSQQSLSHLLPSNTPPSPHAPRRPSGPLARPASPNFRPRSNTPPSQSSALNGEVSSSLPNKLSPPPLPPPLSPNRSHFFSPDERGSLTNFHDRSGSDAAAEREQALKSAEQPYLSMGKIWRTRQSQATTRLRTEPSRETLSNLSPRKDSRKKVPDQDDSLGRSDSWVWVASGSGTQQSELSPPAHDLHRSNAHASRTNLRQPNTPSNFISPLTGRTVAIPSAPRQPPPAVPSISEHRQPVTRPAGRPLPAHLVVSWKADQKKGESPKHRLAKGAKSMDNLRANAFSGHPSTLQPGGRRSNAQLPISRQPAGIPYGPSSPGLSHSHDNRSSTRPLPMQGISISSNMVDRETGHGTYIGRGTMHGGLHSPNQEPYTRPSSAIGDTMASPTKYNRHLQSPVHPTHEYIDNDNRLYGTSPGRPSHTTQHSDSKVENGSNRSSDILSAESSHTPPRTPDGPGTIGRERYEGTPRPAEVPEYTPEPTIKPDDRSMLSSIVSLGDASSESTLISKGAASDEGTIRVSLHPSSPPSTSPELQLPQEESDSDSEDYMFQKPLKSGDTTKTNDRPPLKLQTLSPSGTLEKPVINQHAASSTHLPLPPPAQTSNQRIPTPPKPHRRAPSIPRDKERERERKAARGSTFTDAENTTWAPRPPPEDVYERLEDFFPEHDLDKPVIDANSGGTSPTTAEPPATLPPPVAPTLMPTHAEKHNRMRAKKSIRIVAKEHKELIDRTVRGESTSYSNIARKRSTKLWGSKLEEVTTLQGKGQPAVPTLPESPSGGPTTFKWVRGELIGKGTYGRVYLALNVTTGEMIAVKQVEMPRTMSDKNDARQRTMVQALKMEIETLKDLDHPNIVQYLGFEETPSNLSIFLEYVPGGSIGSCLLKHGKFDERVTKHFTKQILGGLEYLHSKGILHRDLKADNILVEMSGVCKISDFGISKRTDDVDGGAFTAMQGTVFWMAPEVINTQKKGYNSKIDIWSVGCVVLEMWAGMRPWMGDEAVAVMFKLYQSKQPPPVPDDVDLSELADDFRLRCFAINPEDRPTAAELRKHHYLVLPPDWVFTDFRGS